MSMSPEKMRVTIASAMPKGFLEGQRWHWQGAWIYFDPLTDLNAMHEAVNSLSSNQRIEWLGWMFTICGNTDGVALATASQKAEAFLRTLNLYVDDKQPLRPNGEVGDRS